MSFSHSSSAQRFILLLIMSLTTLQTVLCIRGVLSSQPPLRCCLMEEPPISFQNDRNYWNNGLDGVIKEHLLQHQAYLNWTCSSVQVFRGPNTTDFTAFVTTMHECTNKSTGQIIESPDCLCDIGIGGWFQTAGRFGFVDFLPPFVYDRYVVFAPVSEATVSGNVWFFIQTFDGKAWISILSLFIMFSFLKILDRRFAVPATFEPLPKTSSRIRQYAHYLTKSNLPFRLRKGIQSTVMRMIMLSDETVVDNGNTTRQWFVNLILAVTALFLVLSYEASMTASLVQETVETKFQSAADLLNCDVHPSEVCMLRGGALETYWKNSIAIEECHAQNPPNYFNSYTTLFQAVENGQCKYSIVLESAITSAIRKRYCGDFVIAGEPIWNGGLSMLLPKGSNLTEAMSRATLELLGNQTTTSLIRYFNNLPQCKVEVNTTLSFEKLRHFFFIAYSVGGTLFVAMALLPQTNSEENRFREASGNHESPEMVRKPPRRVSCSSTEVSHEDAEV